MRHIMFDIEADGFIEESTTIHCVVGEDVLTGEVTELHGDTLAEAPDYLEADVIIGHNIISYDFGMLKKFYGWEPLSSTTIIDTLTLSQTLNPDRRLPKGCPTSYKLPDGKSKAITPHGVEAWGYRVGRSKPQHFDWDVFSPEMLHRCKEDVGIQILILEALLGEMGCTYMEFVNYLRGQVYVPGWMAACKLELQVSRIIDQQAVSGVVFDSVKAEALVDRIQMEQDSLSREIMPQLTKKVSRPYTVPISQPWVKSGDFSAATKKWYSGAELEAVVGPFTRISIDDPDLGSRIQLQAQFLKLGWKPEIFTEKGSPKLTEKGVPVESLSRIPGTAGTLLARWYIVGHRKSQILGWLRKLRPDGRLSAAANSCGTNTARMRHRVVVNVPKASAEIVYGREMRDLFTVPEGHYMVGHDASGIEARVMGHYTTPIDGGKFASEILTGDIHSKNAKAFFPRQLKGKERGDEGFEAYRDLAKTLFYALIYGAQWGRVKTIMGCSDAEAKAAFKKFWAVNPALSQLRDRVIGLATKYSWLTGLDGRRIYVRSKHSAMNALFQSAGAIIMKVSIVLLDNLKRRELLQATKVIDMHDEGQAEIPKCEIKVKVLKADEDPTPEEGWTSYTRTSEGQVSYYSRYGELAVKSIVVAGKVLKLRCNLDAEYKVGLSWAETH